MEIKVISLWQPWASLMALKHKRFETRSWSTNHRGFIAVHAAQRYKKADQDDYFWKPVFRKALAGGGIERPDDLPFGKILSIHDLRWVFSTDWLKPLLLPEEIEFGNYQPGRFAWKMPRLYQLPEPIPARGYQGLWNWEVPVEIETALNEILEVRVDLR